MERKVFAWTWGSSNLPTAQHGSWWVELLTSRSACRALIICVHCIAATQQSRPALQNLGEHGSVSLPHDCSPDNLAVRPLFYFIMPGFTIYPLISSRIYFSGWSGLRTPIKQGCLAVPSWAVRSVHTWAHALTSLLFQDVCLDQICDW